MNVEIQAQPQRRQPLFITAVYCTGERRVFVTDRSTNAIAYRYSPSVQRRQQRTFISRLDVLKRRTRLEVQADHSDGPGRAHKPWVAIQDATGAATQQNKLVRVDMAASRSSRPYGRRAAKFRAGCLQKLDVGQSKTESDPQIMDTCLRLQPRLSGVRNCYVSNYRGYAGSFRRSMCPIIVHLSRNTIYLRGKLGVCSSGSPLQLGGG